MIKETKKLICTGLYALLMALGIFGGFAGFVWVMVWAHQGGHGGVLAGIFVVFFMWIVCFGTLLDIEQTKERKEKK